MYESSPKRLNSLCKTFQPWEVSGYESFCLEFEQLFPQAPEACSQTKVTGSLSTVSRAVTNLAPFPI